MSELPVESEFSYDQFSRRDFFTLVGGVATAGTFAAALVSSFRYMWPNILYEPPKKYKIGKPEEYPEGVNFIASKRVFVLRGVYGLAPNEYRVISAVCTHMGCTPKWIQKTERFECPCHGSKFNTLGVKVAGPAPKPLPWYQVVVGNDGRLEIDEKKVVTADYKLAV
jgi:Rieske Fe-S protein